MPLAQCDACLLVLFAPCGKHFQPEEQRAQHGVKALDGGDADAADAVELRGLQVLDVVKLGELAAVVGRDELLEFFQGLVAEIAAVVLARLISGFLHEARKIAEI